MVRGTGIGTSILLIALGAILAFAVNLRTTGVDINAIGVILMVVGMIGLVFSFIALGDLDWFGPRRRYYDDRYVEDNLTPPHEHRRVDTRDVIYEDESGAHTERVRHIRR